MDPIPVPDPQDLGGDPPPGLSGQALNSWRHSRERREQARRFGQQMKALSRLVICLHLQRQPAMADIETVAAFAGMDVTSYLAERAERVHVQGNLNTARYDAELHADLVGRQRASQARHMAQARGRVRGLGLLAPGQQVGDVDDLWTGDVAHSPEVLRRIGVTTAPSPFARYDDNPGDPR
jgi:hypothetical protein